MHPAHGGDAEALIRRATVSRYARGPGRRRDAAAELSPADELALTSRLHRAIERREFRLHYQPVVELTTAGRWASRR